MGAEAIEEFRGRSREKIDQAGEIGDRACVGFWLCGRFRH